MKKLLLLALAAIGIVACHKGNNPEDNLADYTVIVYAHVGGNMDNSMEIIWEEIKDKLAALPEGTGKMTKALISVTGLDTTGIIASVATRRTPAAEGSFPRCSAI